MNAYKLIVVFGALLLSRSVVLALQEFPGESIEGFDPCDTADATYGSAYQQVAVKPPADSDFAAAPGAAAACYTPKQFCGEPTDVEAQCRQTAGCVAFSYDSRCGYLKTAAGPRTPRAGWTVYVLDSAASSPAPAANATASPNPSPSPSAPSSAGRRMLMS